MSKTITPDAALNQFMSAVAEAATPWKLDEACEQALRRELAEPFDEAVKAGFWPVAEQKMMRVAAYVGGLGAMLSESRNPKAQPGDLDLDALLRAAGVVQALVCPFDGRATVAGARPVAAGRFCRVGQFGAALDIDQAHKILTGR